MRIGRAADQIVAALDEVAFLDVDHLGLGHQILDRIAAVLGDDRDLALGLVVLAERNPAGDLGDDRILLGLARLEQLRHPRQTAGDVAGLGGFAADAGEHVAALDRLAFLDRQHRARRQHVARRLARLLVEQGDARTQILLGAGGAAVLGDHALGDAGRFVGLLGERLALDQILELHDAALLGDDRHHERIPFGDPVALGDDVAVVDHQVRAVGDAVRSRARGRPCRRSPARRCGPSRCGGRARRRSSAGRGTRSCRRRPPRGSTVSLSWAAPPMWKVRIVSWVPGSPIDWAAMTPTASPMLTGVPRARSRP